VTVFARLLAAFLLGAVVAYRPWRSLVPRWRHVLPLAIENAQAQTLITVAGALMVSVIGDNMARAFGLVGLGAFIRFRSGIKDPRDAAVMFVMIGIGMSCGLGNVPMAIVAAVFSGVVLAVFDATAKPKRRRVRLVIEADDPRMAAPALRAVLQEARVLESPLMATAGAGRLVLEVSMNESEDAASLCDMLQTMDVRGLRRVMLEEARPNGA
jgi:uncharacterized membrane protein YhiD involved in acid resistance